MKVTIRIDNGDGSSTTRPIEVTELRTPSAVAWRYSIEYPEFGTYEHELCWYRGTRSLIYGTKRPGGKWTSTPVINPERFGIDETLKGVRKAVLAFLMKTERVMT